MRNAFTKGPWMVEFQSDENRFVLRNKDGEFGHFCGWSIDGLTTQNEEVSNSQLISSAPELLAALQALLPILDNDAPLARAYGDVGILARAAIEKATKP